MRLTFDEWNRLPESHRRALERAKAAGIITIKAVSLVECEIRASRESIWMPDLLRQYGADT